MKKLTLACLLFIAAVASAQRTIVYCGQFVDVKSGQVLNQVSIVVEGSKIADFQKRIHCVRCN